MHTAFTSIRRSTVALIGAGLALLVLVGIGLYGLLTGPAGGPTSAHRPGTAVSPGATPRTPDSVQTWQDLPPLPRTSDPVRYARAVAQALFTWDTMSGLLPEDYQARILVDADPSGAEVDGLISDLGRYLPSNDTWLQLRQQETQQSLTIQVAGIPASWKGIVRDNPGQLRAGTVAVTIEGTRHRSGRWLGEQQQAARPVAFTVFVICGRSAAEPCHTLRLSRLDEPLR